MGKRQVTGAWLLAGLLIVGSLAGCGYGFRGSVNNLPPDIRGVHIPMFVNATTEPQAETIFANALIYEFNRSRVLEVVPEAQAQAVIVGKVRSVAVETVIFASQTQAQDQKVIVFLEVVCRRLDNQKILWQNLALSRYENFKVSTDPTLTDRNREDAIRKIARDLAERIHNSILENF